MARSEIDQLQSAEAGGATLSQTGVSTIANSAMATDDASSIKQLPKGMRKKVNDPESIKLRE